MTTLFETEWSCPLCGRVSTQTALASTSSFGPPDLDTRPPEPARSALGFWLARCPECGFVGPSDPDPETDDPRGAMREMVDSDTYQRQLEDSEFPETANLYLCRAMIEAAWMDLASAGWLALSAAWACDDAGNVDGARRCRERALEFWARAEEAGEEMIEDGPGASQLLQADLERRVGRFERARERCHRGLSGRPSEPVRSLLEFELELITAGDTDVHSVADVRFRRPR